MDANESGRDTKTIPYDLVLCRESMNAGIACAELRTPLTPLVAGPFMKCTFGHRESRRSARSGFSLVEAVVGLAVFGVMLMTFFLGLYQSLTVVRTARETLRGTQIATEKMDTLRLYTWTQLNTPGFVATNFQVKFDPLSTSKSSITYTGLVQILDAKLPDGEPYSTNTKQVTITLRWQSSVPARQLQMTTYVSRYGLSTFVP